MNRSKYKDKNNLNNVRPKKRTSRTEALLVMQTIVPNRNKAQNQHIIAFEEIMDLSILNWRYHPNHHITDRLVFINKDKDKLGFILAFLKICLKMIFTKRYPIIISAYTPKSINLSLVLMLCCLVADKRRLFIFDVWDDPMKGTYERITKDTNRGLKRFLKEKKAKLFTNWYRAAIRKFDYMISSLTPKFNTERYPFPEHRTKFLTLGVDLEYIKEMAQLVLKEMEDQDSNDNIYLFYATGEIIYERGVDILLDAVKMIAEHINQPLEIEIIGRRSHSESWLNDKSLSFKNMGIKLYFSDVQPHREIIKRILKSKFGIIPHRDMLDYRYGYTVKLFEFMALNIPIIAPSMDGIKRVLANEYTALLFEPGDPKDLAKCMLRLLKFPELAQRLVSNISKDIEKYDWYRIRLDLIQFIEKIIDTSSM